MQTPPKAVRGEERLRGFSLLLTGRIQSSACIPVGQIGQKAEGEGMVGGGL